MEGAIVIFCVVVFTVTYFLCKSNEEPSNPPRKSRETLNEVCPNEGTGFFAVNPMDEL